MSVLKSIKYHEGFRSRVYKCTEGYDTIGYGFAIKDLEMDEDIAELILIRKLEKLQYRIASTFGWWYNSPKPVKDVVTNMCYQLGISGFSQFKKTIYLLETEQYEDASIEMLDSLWAKQTPNRAKELSEQLRDFAENNNQKKEH
tara:strand:- start:176 stop:607 length:432 start_codon:yes stop_codon:yes gene_type:complete